jgi:fermentation-respiration switch protein FrsA (DUF1100 family)
VHWHDPFTPASGGTEVAGHIMQASWKSAAAFARKHWILAAAIAFAAGISMTPHTLERLLIYFPMKQLEGDPSSIGLSFQDIYPVTEDRIRLHGWFIPSRNADRTLLIFHGNAGNISHRLPWIEMLLDAKANVMIIDYRGYGKSEGSPFENGLYLDALAAHRWWAKERAGSGEKLILVGESLGGAVAVDLAAHTAPAGLILQSTFTSAREMARAMFPLGLLQPLARVRFDSAAKMARIACPKLIIH